MFELVAFEGAVVRIEIILLNSRRGMHKCSRNAAPLMWLELQKKFLPPTKF